jgi:hypothetical protein
VGSALMTSARQMARQEIGLEQLHLAARGGMGLERFYAKLGWREIGRWPGALRLAPGSRAVSQVRGPMKETNDDAVDRG